MPYVYSLAWKVTNENYTIMRALPFDFINDSVTYTINDQYMFGPAFLVNPVVKPLYYLQNNFKLDSSDYTRDVYLPKDFKWFDFWTGNQFDGGRQIKSDARYETMPLYVKAGSIIPFGPFIQYSTEKNDPIELRIYTGADGEFTLYEDENDNYNYEKGINSLITFNWNNTKKALTISDRKGTFPGMLKERTFTIVIVDTTKGTGIEISKEPNKVIHYTGNKSVIKISD